MKIAATGGKAAPAQRFRTRAARYRSVHNLPGWQRRLVTVPLLGALWLLTLVLLPGLLVVAVVVDLVRLVRSGVPPTTARLVVFVLTYLTAEVVAVVAAFLIWLWAARGSDRQQILQHTYALQKWWADTLWESARWIFRLRLNVAGAEAAAPGPILVLSRHASIVDNLLPFQIFSRRHGIRLRYVLKKELLTDPALDIVGCRLPNHFVDRKGIDTDFEVNSLRDLAANLGVDEGVLIFPEGTRFSLEKQRRAVAALTKNPRLHQMGSNLVSLLPPRPGGVSALLDASPADVVILGHNGLDGFARLPDVWSGGLVGQEINVKLWRIPRAEIPEGRTERADWLYGAWTEMDSWLNGTPARGTSDV